MSEQIDLLKYAIKYADKGFAVFPLKKDKSPYIKSWQTKASSDPAVIRSWWDKWPNANIGIAMGRMSGGIYVIDMDIDEDADKNGYHEMKEFQRKYGELPESWLSITGRGGYHYFFHSDNDDIRNRIGILPGVDVRGDGGYIVAPPSIHENGNSYEWEQNWEDDIEIAEKNDTISYFLSIGTNQQQTEHFVAPDNIPKGERNGMLYKIACSLQAKGLSDSAILAAVDEENAEKCSPPVDASEVRQIVNSALKYQKGKPIYENALGELTQGQREPIFDLTNDGKIRKSIHNIAEAIEFDEKLYGSIKYNLLARSIYVYGALPWDTSGVCRQWKNSDDSNLKMYLEKRYAFSSKEKVMDALTIVADKNKYNPVVDVLEQIYREHKDHCTGSIKRLLPDYLGVEDSRYTFEVMKVFMLGAISRVFYPGCKFDLMLIIYGPQGVGKSEFLRRLSINSDWFNDNFSTFEGDKAAEKIDGMWIVEVSELKALRSAKDEETIKAFLTSRGDKYRGAYERRSESRPRMCVFAGTTNTKNVLADKTGGRRYLPIISKSECVKKSLFENHEDVNKDFAMAWAEAMKFFYESDKYPFLDLPSDMKEAAVVMQEEFSEDDYRVGMIQEWLDQTDCSKVCVPMLIEYALKLEPQKMPQKYKREVQEIIEHQIQGWGRLKNKDRGKARFGKYGKQIAFIKNDDFGAQ